MPIMPYPGQADEALARARARDGGGPKSCTHWIGSENRYCHATEAVRRYVVGYRCPAHTPNALRGMPEAPPGPGIPAYRTETGR